MGMYANLQRLITVEGDASSGFNSTMVQPSADWIDAANWDNGIFTLQVYNVTTSSSDTIDFDLRTLTEQTNPQLTASGGLATSIWEKTSISSGTVDKKAIYSHSDNANPMERFVFWALKNNGTGGAWRVSFKVTCILKTPA